MRGQIAFRPQGQKGSRELFGAVGIIEVAIGSLPQDAVLGIDLFGSPERFRMGFTGHVQDVSDLMEGDTINGIARNEVWPMPRREIDAGGAIVLRRTRMPTDAGKEIMALIGLFITPPGAIHSGMRYDLDVRTSVLPHESGVVGRFDATNPQPCAPLQERGVNLGTLLERPIWGFGAEPVGFFSTLRLETMAFLRRYEDVRSKPENTWSADETAFMQVAKDRRDITSIFYSRDRDDTFARFNRLWKERYGPEDWSMVLTANEILHRQELARELVEEVLAENTPFMRA